MAVDILVSDGVRLGKRFPRTGSGKIHSAATDAIWLFVLPRPRQLSTCTRHLSAQLPNYVLNVLGQQCVRSCGIKLLRRKENRGKMKGSHNGLYIFHFWPNGVRGQTFAQSFGTYNNFFLFLFANSTGMTLTMLTYNSSYWRRCILWIMSRQSLNTRFIFSVSTAHVKCG